MTDPALVFMFTSLALSIGYKTNRLKAAKDHHQAQENYFQALNTAKNEFFTNISHEFRTPLTVITGMVSQMKNQPQQWTDKGLTMIERNADQLLSLVNQLLDLSKLESGKMELQYQQGNILHYLKYLVESMHSLAASKQVVVHFYSEEEEIVMDYDREKIQRILLNLLSNAIKFTPEKGNVYVSINQVEQKKQAFLQLKVRDTGRGIAEDQLPYIFNRFYQVDGTSTRQGEGSGIGLALVKEIITLLEGTIDVKSKVNQGTTFTLQLPIHNQAVELIDSVEPIKTIVIPAEVPQDLPKESLVIPTPKLAGTTKQRLLIIEDNPDVIAYLISFLDEGYDIQVGQNGQEGIDIALETVPDLIITDVMMPIKDGLEVCQTLKKEERTSHIPIIMLTAKTDRNSKIAGLEQGADAYLSKPFYPKELSVRLEQLSENRRRLQAKYSKGELIQQAAPKTEDIYLQKAQQAILENLEASHFGPNELARALETNRTQLHNKLKALTNQSTTKYINKVRLQKAKELLATSDQTISEIAYATGFKSIQYFSNSFSKEFKLSPRAFRSGLSK